jgi:hypothetical protein
MLFGWAKMKVASQPPAMIFVWVAEHEGIDIIPSFIILFETVPEHRSDIWRVIVVFVISRLSDVDVD